MSAAGQMETFLGVPAADFDQVLEKVAKCWASQFSFSAVNYKRQFGKPIASRMAVVVQEMVPSQVSGVMFTCDPVTADPRIITISANYGLGESAVGARVDPDHFTVIRAAGQEMKIASRSIGKKKFFITQNPDGGTVEWEVGENDSEKACLTDDVIMKLASVGHQVESCFTTARDIEWAIVDDQIYLIQNRHVTTIARDTDFEIINDMNGNIKSEGDIFSKANILEIFPGALSPLGISTLTATFDVLCREFQLQWRELDVVESSLYVTASINTLRKQIFLDASDSLLGDGGEKWRMFATHGRDISKEKALAEGVRRAPLPAGRFAAAMSLLSLPKMFFLNRNLVKISEGSKSFKVPLKPFSSLEQLNAIVVAFNDVKEAALACCHAFLETSFFDGMVMSLLAKSTAGEMTTEILVAAANLLKASDLIESVDVVLSLDKLGSLLRERIDKDEFLSMSPDKALEWINSSESEVGVMFSEFLERHGHRCVKEFDVQSETWAMRPTSLVKALQAIARTTREARTSAPQGKSIGNLGNLRLSYLQRFLLHVFVPRARKAIAHREIAKSGIVRIIHQLRLAFHTLAELMVSEGRLPHKDLVFYLSVDELHRLITSCQHKLISRAIRRQRLHPRLDDEKYPLLLYGFPRRCEPKELRRAVMEVTGTPICQGVVDGRARVIKNFGREAHRIEKDEILITTATDLGWTPYFPLLAGVVTEAGGLISHGAVVAREYGIPCVVGIENVTEIFGTGDLVRLDATHGVVRIIQRSR
ncbi:uncharacterized protein LOC100898270 [Galendromus occidentalis]|uniref:Uncharacterized protein LOC100898270 n=1 Tax=Galendromus occidentalis TaxID=34638 RepID=A0AAJ7SEX2_9ACAR|nr:uncharacterized protein LOC100898270 [Galendromus occidentalis]